MSERTSVTEEIEVPGEEALPWYALRVRSNHERVTSAHLRNRGIEEFAPTFKAQRQWSDRKRQVDQYLFTGYVFCRLDPKKRLPVVTVPGAISLVGFGNGPIAIPSEQIEAARRLASSELLVSPWPFLHVGERVVIERGPLAGIEGVLQEIRKTFRLVVSIGLLQRSISAEVDRSWIRPLGSRIAAPEAQGAHASVGINPMVVVR